LVELRVCAGDDEADVLAGLARNLAHDARELVEDLTERHHAHFENAGLQLVDFSIERAHLVMEHARDLHLRAVVLEPVEHGRDAGGGIWGRWASGSPPLGGPLGAGGAGAGAGAAAAAGPAAAASLRGGRVRLRERGGGVRGRGGGVPGGDARGTSPTSALVPS